MTDPRKAALLRIRPGKHSLKRYAGLLRSSDLKDKKAFLAPIYVEEQMILPTMEVYLSTEMPVEGTSNAAGPRKPRPRRKALATVRVWERLF